MEVWKDVIGYENIYQVSDLGRIKSLNREVIRKDGVTSLLKGRIKKTSIHPDGYEILRLHKDGIGSSRKVHQLVAESFLNHNRCGFKLVINHKNFNRSDNRLENLEVVSQRENANLKHFKSSSKYTGVSWDKSKSKWIAQIRTGSKTKYLGRYVNEIDAANAYQKALKEIILLR